MSDIEAARDNVRDILDRLVSIRDALNAVPTDDVNQIIDALSELVARPRPEVSVAAFPGYFHVAVQPVAGEAVWVSGRYSDGLVADRDDAAVFRDAAAAERVAGEWRAALGCGVTS